MSKPTETSKLAALEKSLPDRIRAAAREVSIAEQHLAQILTTRAAGEPVRGAGVAVARMALARAQRNAEDLQRIRNALPAMLEQARDTARLEGERAANQTWPGAKVSLLSRD